MNPFVVASFDREAAFRAAAARAAAEGRSIAGCWSPYPVEGVVETAGARGIAGAVALSGVGMAAALYGLEAWSAIIAYPFDAGARALHSWQAFLVAPIEFGALCAAIGGLVALVVRARLTELHHPAFDLAELARASRDRFVLALACADDDDASAAAALLEEAGAASSRVVTP